MAFNFGPANEYNVFIFGDMSMSNTDAEGRVAVGGNASLSNYGLGAGIFPLPPAGTDPSFVIGGNVSVSAGSNASGNTVISPSSTVISYTMGNPNGMLVTGTPIDFQETERYLKCASAFWGGLESNGSGEVIFNQLNLTGTDESLNVFSFDGGNIYGSGLSLSQLNGINIIAPRIIYYSDKCCRCQYPVRKLSDIPQRHRRYQRKCPEDIVEFPGSTDLVKQYHCDLRLRAGPLCRGQHHLQPDQRKHRL